MIVHIRTSAARSLLMHFILKMWKMLVMNGLRVGHADVQLAPVVMASGFHHLFGCQLHLSWQQA